MQTTGLHISGLTPSITQNDLKQRFGTFGEVREVHGVGKLDGLGQPRKFAYVTLESTQAKLARCMNLLSGSTWKGAKLRIGEAKPDYRARHQLETNPPPPAPRPKLDAAALKRARLKRRLRARRLMRGVQGREAKDMSLVTLENVDKQKGWRRTPLNHLIRPLRMRPLHPIPLPPKRHQLKSKPKSKTKPGAKKKVFKLMRARCTVIDPTRYGAVHVLAGKGGLGDLLFVGAISSEVATEETARQKDFDMVEVASTISSGESTDGEAEVIPTQMPPPLPVLPPRNPTPPISKSLTPPASRTILLDNSLAKEKADTLALLGGLFPGDEWGGRESVSGDEVEVQDAEGVGEDTGYEIIPKEGGEGSLAADDEVEEIEDAAEGEDDGTASDMDEQDDSASEEDHSEAELPAPDIRLSALKDMFKPQEESAGFSLDLDIELDPDTESFLPASVQPQPQPSMTTTVPVTIQQTTTQAHTIQYTPDPRAMMFFPGGKRDVFSVIAEKGWRWEHPGTPDEIKAKWEQNKAELTREYTRRHREAVKRRRRGGVVRGEEL
ncbi:hypothetical protein FS749_008679 [Ceratobasidium sp. UAMH 11750]|nr:hypothetical protein FS749_008679 [Ceratobasidium sp. UAMH 11750]